MSNHTAYKRTPLGGVGPLAGNGIPGAAISLESGTRRRRLARPGNLGTRPVAPRKGLTGLDFPVVRKRLVGAVESGEVEPANRSRQPADRSWPERRLRVLTDRQLADFRRDGFLIVEDLVDPEITTRLAERADLIASGRGTAIAEQYVQLEAPLPDAGAGNRGAATAVRKMYQLARHDEVLREHACAARLVDVIADLLATEDLKLYNDQLFMKPAYHGGEQAWHQDSQAWLNMFPMDMVTAWTAIDEATVANGCLWMAVGSHRWGMIPDAARERVESLLDGDWPTAPVELRPGSVSFHHSLTYHRSGANHSPRRRRGYATHYMRARTWYLSELRARPDLLPFLSIRGREFPGCV